MNEEPCNRGDEWTEEQLRQGWRTEKYISLMSPDWQGGKTRRKAPSELLALYEVRQLRREVAELRAKVEGVI